MSVDSKCAASRSKFDPIDIQTIDGVGLIPIGSIIVWEHKPGGNLKRVYGPFDHPMRHPLTIGVSESSASLLLESGARRWRLVMAEGRMIRLQPLHVLPEEE